MNLSSQILVASKTLYLVPPWMQVSIVRGSSSYSYLLLGGLAGGLTAPNNFRAMMRGKGAKIRGCVEDMMSASVSLSYNGDGRRSKLMERHSLRPVIVIRVIVDQCRCRWRVC